MNSRTRLSCNTKSRKRSAGPVSLPLRLPLAAALLALGVPALAQPSEQQLQEVVVSASGFEQEVKEAPASISVITREQLESERVSSIADALRGVEGVDVSAAPGKTGGLNISMRGMSSQYTLIMIDGVRQNPAGGITPNGFGETSTSFLPPPSAIERIEVIRGPMSTLYGSEALGGVVNIITRKVGKTWTGSVTGEATFQGDSQFGDSRAGSIYLSGPLVQDTLGLQVRARRFKRDESNIQWPGKTPGALTLGNDPVQATIDTVGARLTWTPTRAHDLSLDLEQGRQTYDNSRGQLGTLDTPARKSGYLPEQRYERDKFILSHTWRLPNSVLDTKLSYVDTETIGRTIPDNTPGRVAGAPRKLQSDSTVLDTKWTTSLDAHMLTLGGQWWEADMVDGVAASNFSYRQIGVFAEDEWQLRDDLALTLGARYDDHSTFGGNFTPRAYLVWQANDRWTFKGGVSKGYRTPGLEQLYNGISGYGRQGTQPIYGNPDLQPEKSRTTEFGVYFDSGNGLRTNATLFHTAFDDAISNQTYTPPGGRQGSRPVNVDEAVLRGVELGAGIDLTRALHLKASYTYIDSEQRSGANIGDPLNDTPKHTVSAALNWQATPKLATWARAEYFDSRFRSRDVAGTNTKALLGDYKSYGLLHVGATYKFNDAWALNAAIYNLLDEDFVDYRPVTASNAPSFANTYHTTGEPRRLWVSLNYTF